MHFQQFICLMRLDPLALHAIVITLWISVTADTLHIKLLVLSSCLNMHDWAGRWSGVCLVPEVNSGHRYRWLWWNGEHYWNASHLRLILSPQSVSDRRKDLLTAGCPLPPSVCLFLSHIRIQALQFTPLCGYIHFPDFWCSLSWSSKPQMFGLHSSIEEQQAALLFSLSFFRPKPSHFWKV